MRLPALLLVPLAVAALATPAVAAWVTSGTGTTALAATSLLPPTGVVATGAASTVDLTWTAPANPAGAVFRVVRSPGAVTLACTSSPCQDSGLAAGTTYTYAVSVALAGWASAAVTASATTTGGLLVTGATANRPGKVRVSGTGAVAGVPVDVALCLGALPVCTTTTLGYLETLSVTPAAAGAWTTGPSGTKALPGVAYTAAAVQAGAVSPPYVFTG